MVSAFVEEASSGRVKGYPSPMFLAILFLVVNFGGGWNNFDGITPEVVFKRSEMKLKCEQSLAFAFVA